MKKEKIMTDTITIKAEKRDENKNPRELRTSGMLPATVYGKGMDSLSIQFDAKEFALEYKKNPEAKFNVVVDSKSYKTEVANVQMNYSTAKQLNVEFKLV